MSTAMEFVCSAMLASLMVSAIVICYQLQRIASALERGAPYMPRRPETPDT
jgi:hypothetical protein